MAGAMASMVHELELRGAITRPWLEMNLGESPPARLITPG